MNVRAEHDSIVFRAMAEADIAAVRSLHARSFAILARDHHTQDQIDGHLALIADPAYADELRCYHIGLAVEDGEIVGTAGWLAVSEQPGTARIRKVFVHPDMARRGLGSRMVQRVEDEIRQAGYRRLIVRANLNAIMLYDKLGYVATGGSRMVVGSGIELPVVMMEKTFK